MPPASSALSQNPRRPGSIGRALAVLTEIEYRDFFPEPLRQELLALVDDLVVVDPLRHDGLDLAALLAETRPEVLIGCWKTPPLPQRLPQELRYVCYLCGSVRKFVARSHVEQGLVVTNWGGSISRIVAEWALFHVLACLRRATYWTLAMHCEGAWKDERTETASLFGRRVGIHGFGAIARRLVGLLAPFDCTISVFAPDVDAATEREFGIQGVDSLETLFADSDVVVEVAPLIPETVGSVTERHLRLLRPGSVFVNVGRGAVVDEDALVRVAAEGRVQFGLDVFTCEPLPVDHPLRGMANVSLTPHLAGPTTDRRRDAGAFALENLRAYAEGRPLQAVITPEVYDRST
jgi:phosphoglycerate dehydrogenase-like enzyme